MLYLSNHWPHLLVAFVVCLAITFGAHLIQIFRVRGDRGLSKTLAVITLLGYLGTIVSTILGVIALVYYFIMLAKA